MEQPKKRRRKENPTTEWTPTDLQQAFVEEYLRCWNAVEAGRKAGYKAPEKCWRNLQNPDIKAMIAARMAEITMETNEVLTRLSQQARNNLGDYLILSDDGKRFEVDWTKLKDAGHLVKKISFSQKGQPVIEFYDSQKALELIGRAQGMFVDRSEVKVGELNPVQVYLPDNGRVGVEPAVDTEQKAEDEAN